MIIKAQIPDMPESRSLQMPVRLARKVGPLFGVHWDQAPGAMGAWCCDYTGVTLAEIMRGAPRPAKRTAAGGLKDRGVSDDDMKAHTPIANATAARFGPDTKAAFVLVGANALLAPVADAFEVALETVDVDDAPLLIGAFGYCLVEVFRSEPTLLVAALQAQAVQRALGAVAVPVQTGGLLGLAAHEFGAGHVGYEQGSSPMSLDLLERLARALCARLDPVETTDLESVEPVSGGSPRDRLSRTVAAMAQATLFDLSPSVTDAGLRIIDGAGGRSAELDVRTTVRIKRFAQAVAPHVRATPSSETPYVPMELEGKLRLLQPLVDAEPPVGTDLQRRAWLTLQRGLLTAALVQYRDREESARHLRAGLLARHAEQVGAVVGRDSPEYRMELMMALSEFIQYPAARDEAPDDPEVVARRRQWLDESVELARTLLAEVEAGTADGGRLSARLDDLLVAINQMRRAQARNPVATLPDAEALTGILSGLWEGYRKLLDAFFGPGTDRHTLRLHNYGGFLLGAGSSRSMRAEGLALLGERVIPVRRRAGEHGAPFTPLRNSLQVALRGHTAMAVDLRVDDPEAARRNLAAARAYAEEILARGDEMSMFLGGAGTIASAFIAATALAECFLTCAEFAGSDPEQQRQRAQWIAEAERLLALAAPYVQDEQGKVRRNRADRKAHHGMLCRRLADLQGTGSGG